MTAEDRIWNTGHAAGLRSAREAIDWLFVKAGLEEPDSACDRHPQGCAPDSHAGEGADPTVEWINGRLRDGTL